MLPPRLAGFCAVLIVGPWVAACSQPPFDAQSAWIPMQADERASFSGGILASSPSAGFDLFERDLPERAGPVSVPRPGGENPWATPRRNVVVTVCYGELVNDPEEVRRSARNLCPPDSRLEPVGTDSFWNACPLLQPTRAAFRCRPASGAAGGDGANQLEGGAIRTPASKDESQG